MTWNVIGKDDTREKDQQQKLQLLKSIIPPHLPSLTPTSKIKKISMTFSTSLHRNLTPNSNTETPAHPKTAREFCLFSSFLERSHFCPCPLTPLLILFSTEAYHFIERGEEKVCKTMDFFLSHENKS